MFRVVAILLAFAVGCDHFILDGKYEKAAERLAYLLLHRL
jgi:hypothetical protein